MTGGPGQRRGRTGDTLARRRGGGHTRLRQRRGSRPRGGTARCPGAAAGRRGTRCPARFRTAPRLAAARPSHTAAAGVPPLARLRQERPGTLRHQPEHPRPPRCLPGRERDGRRAATPPDLRAARAYLDVCFFHPFDDGNARSAFLTLLFVLAREGVALNGVGLLRRITFQAGNPQDPLTLARYIDVHHAETRHSAASPGS
ncbi:Fic family protein [Streptomyces canus]|uniref:Fic family protein n=1 Tax=Streptomyces canus TaxID=58343 RepID=UPI00371A76DE